MRKIYLLTDYKGRFGSKYNDSPYRSGFDKDLITDYFKLNGFETEYRNFNDIDFTSDEYINNFILYTSSEDLGYHYKSYIEDIILGLELAGAIILPAFKYLRANNNKVFMEILRNQMTGAEYQNITSKHYGTYEDLLKKVEFNDNKYVIKKAEGASGSGVFLGNGYNDLLAKARKISRTRNLSGELWEIGRVFKHKGYQKESKYRKKFIIQNFIPDLKNDWKVYAFGSKYYIFYRPVFKHRGFRASGGGYENYFYGMAANAPEGLFDFAEKVFQELNVPHASLDIAFDGKNFYLLEFQCLYFGTAGIYKSKECFSKINDTWQAIPSDLKQEEVYVNSVVEFISKQERK